MSGTAGKHQVESLLVEFSQNLEKINASPLPIGAKLQSVNTILLSKLGFYFSNLNFAEKQLKDVENQIVRNVRDWLALNNSSTRSFMFLPRKEGGLGLLKPSSIYHAKKLSFLISCLNSDDQQVKMTARESMKLHMTKRKVPYVEGTDDPNFGGYLLDEEGKLMKNCKVNWGRSEFVYLNELCVRLGIKLEFDGTEYKLVIDHGDGIHFASGDAKFIYNQIKFRSLEVDRQYWSNLKNQGRVYREAFPSADAKASNEHLNNLHVNDNLTQFITKGRLQILETQAMLNIYYPDVHDKKCPMCGFIPDTASHVLSSCQSFRTMYIERHDRTVNHLENELTKLPKYANYTVMNNKLVTPAVFNKNEFNQCVQFNKPDIFLVSHETKVAYIVEISHPFDAFIDKCYNSKFDKYFPLCLAIQDFGYECKIIVLVAGALGIVHKHFVPGLRILGFNNVVAKAIAKYVSISSMIGSRRVWRRRMR